MAFHFLIDGYNLLYALSDIPPGTLQEKRESLLRLLRERHLQGRNKVTIVFDSRQGVGNQSQREEVTVVFTAGETADEWISGQVRRALQPRTLVVVSNDQGIRSDVKGTGARFLTADDFLKGVKEHSSQDPLPKDEPPSSEKITEEFKEKWL